MNVVFLGVLAEHPISSILLDVLILLSLLGAAMLMLSALLGSDSSSAQKCARVEILVPVTRVRQRHRAMLRPWEVPCAGGGATRAPPGPSPIQRAPSSSSKPAESDQS